MEITLNIASLSDSNTLVQFMREFYAFEHLPFDETVARRAVTQLLGDESLGSVWLITADAEPVGYIVLAFGFSLEYGGRDAFIDEFYLREEYRGQGLGTRALRWVEDACRSLGVRVLHLEVSRENVTAQRVYRKVGFVDHDRYLLSKDILVKGTD
jgi:diamine N-acetyltransferase